MGDHVFSESGYSAAVKKHIKESGPVTSVAEQRARLTGKLHPLVDPAEYGVIRRSLPRFNQLVSGQYQLSVGFPIPSETRIDTTGSMGNNVDTAIKVLPSSYDLCIQMLPGYDLQMAIGIFGDISDNFVLCRPQFEMTAEKIVEQLTLMVPERDGGDFAEDPHYGLFGAAYLTDARINKYGLMGYDFTVSDAPARDTLSTSQLTRIFGNQVFDKVVENGHDISNWDDNYIYTKEIVKDLLKRTHAFFLQVDNDQTTRRFWVDVFGAERVVLLPDTKYLPHVQATIIGLTEGVLELSGVYDFLVKNNVDIDTANVIVKSVSNIPIGKQAALKSRLSSELPKKGDIFNSKTDLWPTTEVKKTEHDFKKSGIGWL